MTIHPTREEFKRLAAEYSVIPVWRELLADMTTPVAAFARLTRDGEPGFLFESVEHGERWGRWSFVGRRPAATLVSRGTGEVEVRGTDYLILRERDIHAVAAKRLEEGSTGLYL